MVAVALPAGFFVLRWLMQMLGLRPGTAAWFAAVACGLWLVHAVLYARMFWSSWFPRRWELPATALVWAAMPATAAAAIGLGTFRLPPLGATVLAVVVGLIALPLIWRRSVEHARTQVRLPKQLQSLGDVDAEIAACRAELADSSLPVRHRTRVEINLGSALAEGAALADRPDALDEAITILDLVARSPDAEPWSRLRAAWELVGARDLQAARHDDDRGYQDALRLEFELAEQMLPDPVPLARAHFDTAQFHQYRASRPGTSPEEARRQAELATQALRHALAASPPGSDLIPIALAQLTPLTSLLDESDAILDEQIGQVREALRGFSVRKRYGREAVQLALATLLLTRVERAEEITPDLDEAETLCHRVLRRRTMLDGQAYELLARAIQLRLDYGCLTDFSTDDAADDSQRARRLVGKRIDLLRRAFEAQVGLSLTDASEIGLRWAEAAAEANDVQAAAEAYWQVTSQVPHEVLRRLSYTDREHAVLTVQGLAAEAGYWLAAARRLEDAVLAIEFARAILVGLRAQRLPADLADRLRTVGRSELYHRYIQAAERLASIERAQHAEPVEHQDRSVTDPTTAVSAEQRTWSDYDRVVHEINAALGGGFGSPSYSDVQRAAADGPVVYLAAAEHGGYAFVVNASGAPSPVQLPDLTRTALDAHVDKYLSALRNLTGSRRILDEVLEWLWVAIMRRVVAAVAPNALLTVVPVGPLALLPLHAATAAARPGEPPHFVDDHVVLRYAPSARMAQQARREAAEAETGTPTLLAVDVPDAPGYRTLQLSTTETREVCRRYPPGGRRLPNARHAETIASLGSATVWHFACHGSFHPEDPLRSALLLADQPLTLREILGRPPGRHRLAVLSACETNIPDRNRFDEVIGFPGALLQAGIAGVVASSWEVRDAAATFLVLRFHELCRAGHPPPVALALAQRWIRTAENRELQSILPGEYGPPKGTPEHRLAQWLKQRPFSTPRHWAAFSCTGA
jgi:hypothetical protein